MFKNIGRKIKLLAQIFCWFQILIAVIGGIVVMVLLGKVINPFTAFLAGLLVIALLSLAAWISSFVIYGYGQLIDNTDKLVTLAVRNERRQTGAARPQNVPVQGQYNQQNY